ncbi:MAG: hypothetical protein R3275_02325 [Saprospiraceae bacterium]|nr:hypothetical protein [Saprospiraceae bacterium]
MTLSLGVEAQAITPGDAAEIQSGVSLVGDVEASQRLKAHIGQLEAQQPQTDEERANVQFRYDYGMYIMDDVGQSYKYTLLNSLPWLQERSDQAFENSGIRVDAQEVYDEMIDLLRS